MNVIKVLPHENRMQHVTSKIPTTDQKLRIQGDAVRRWRISKMSTLDTFSGHPNQNSGKSKIWKIHTLSCKWKAQPSNIKLVTLDTVLMHAVIVIIITLLALHSCLEDFYLCPLLLKEDFKYISSSTIHRGGNVENGSPTYAVSATTTHRPKCLSPFLLLFTHRWQWFKINSQYWSLLVYILF